jgi:hypothetical protein
MNLLLLSAHARDPCSGRSSLSAHWTSLVRMTLDSMAIVALFPSWGEPSNAPPIPAPVDRWLRDVLEAGVSIDEVS